MFYPHCLCSYLIETLYQCWRIQNWRIPLEHALVFVICFDGFLKSDDRRENKNMFLKSWEGNVSNSNCIVMKQLEFSQNKAISQSKCFNSDMIIILRGIWSCIQFWCSFAAIPLSNSIRISRSNHMTYKHSIKYY